MVIGVPPRHHHSTKLTIFFSLQIQSFRFSIVPPAQLCQSDPTPVVRPRPRVKTSTLAAFGSLPQPQTPVQPPVPPNTTDDAIQRLADTLASTLQNQPPRAQRNDDSRVAQFMARQSVGSNLPTFSGAPEVWPVFRALLD